MTLSEQELTAAGHKLKYVPWPVDYFACTECRAEVFERGSEYSLAPEVIGKKTCKQAVAEGWTRS